jgi:hypothetical protein
LKHFRFYQVLEGYKVPRKRKKLRVPEPLLESIPQFARRSGLGQSLTRHLIFTRELPSCTINGRRWIPVEEALAALRSKVEPRPAA